MRTRGLAVAGAMTAVVVVVPGPAFPAPTAPHGPAGACSGFHRVAQKELKTDSGQSVGRISLLVETGTQRFCGRTRIFGPFRDPDITVDVEIEVRSTHDGEGAGNASSSTHVVPIVIDAHDFPTGSKVRYVVTYRGRTPIKGAVGTTVG